VAQRKLMGLAEHHPEEVSAKNKGVLSMSKSDLHDFASTPEKGLPKRKKKSEYQKAYEKRHKD
jgi:hypothetical protein